MIRYKYDANANSSKINNLMIVAHPDDEIIFGGLILSRYQHQSWTILCVTNASHVQRSTEFIKVMSVLGCSYEMWDYNDPCTINRKHLCRNGLCLSCLTYPNNNYHDDLRQYLLTNGYKYRRIISHNINGEYGHPHHIMVGQTIQNLISEFELNVKYYQFHLSKHKIKYKYCNFKHRLLQIYQSQIADIRHHKNIYKYINYGIVLRKT